MPDSAEEPVIYALRAKVGSENRLSIPVPLLRMMPWWSGAAGETICELVEVGLMRVVGKDEALPILEDLMQSQLSDSDLAHERRMAARDKFRSLSLYEDGRLRLTQEVIRLLDPASSEELFLYVQAAGRALEVMSEAYRTGRLAKHRGVTLGLHARE